VSYGYRLGHRGRVGWKEGFSSAYKDGEGGASEGQTFQGLNFNTVLLLTAMFDFCLGFLKLYAFRLCLLGFDIEVYNGMLGTGLALLSKSWFPVHL
jgi:hypothetical protein